MRLKGGSLRSRVTIAAIVLGAIVSVGLSAAVYTTMRSIEHSLVDDAMRAELDYVIETGVAAPGATFQSRTTQIYVAHEAELGWLPDEIESLTPGFHIVDADVAYRVLVRDHQGRRLFLRFNDQAAEQRLESFFKVLAIGVVATTAVAAWLGLMLARHVIAPVVRLAEEVRTTAPDTEAPVFVDYSDDEVGMLAGQFRRNRAELIELLQREREFVGNVSHELRTPTTSINLATEVLLGDETLSDMSRQRLQRIHRAGREMSELVSAFLILARGDVDEASEATICDIGAIVDEVVQDQRVWLGQKPIEVCVRQEAMLSVVAPRAVLIALIGNLVRNAFRYTAQGSISVETFDDRIEVADTGPGIDDDQRERIFDRRVHGPDASAGSGFGLSIVKRICERYGWSVEVESEVGWGSTFTVRFDV